MNEQVCAEHERLCTERFARDKERLNDLEVLTRKISECNIKVVGSRRVDKSGYEGYTLKRKIMSEVYIKVINFASGYKGSDSQCGIKGFSNNSAKRIFSRTTVDRFAFDLEALLLAKKAKMVIAEVPVKVINHNDSKVRPIHDSLEMLSCIRKIKKHVKNVEI